MRHAWNGWALILLCVSLSPVSLHAENWPGWRGPLRTGVTTETGIPVTWSASENIRWKVAVPGTGISNPVVWNDHVFLTASEGRDQGELHLICLDRVHGQTRWHRQVWGTAPTLFYYPKSGMASPSPVTDGQHVWAFFGTGDVFCFNMEGDLVWQRSLAEEYGPFENRFAASSSPLLFEDSLILQCDHYGASYLLAIDKLKGSNLWKSDRPEAWLSWASPQLIEADDRMELLISGSEKLDGYDPRTGERLWTVRGMARECVPTPVLGDGVLFAVSGPNGQHLAIRPGGRGDVTDTHVNWRNDKGTSFVPSGIVVGKRYYLADDKGIATCLDTSNGKVLWRKRLGGKFTASPVAAEGRVYFTNEEGSTLVLDGSAATYKELARNELHEEVLSSPAISQGQIFIRSATHLYCIGPR